MEYCAFQDSWEQIMEEHKLEATAAAAGNPPEVVNVEEGAINVLAEATVSANPEAHNLQQSWNRFAEQTVRTSITLTVAPVDAETLEEDLK
jgi:hypothetical protein